MPGYLAAEFGAGLTKNIAGDFSVCEAEPGLHGAAGCSAQRQLPLHRSRLPGCAACSTVPRPGPQE